MRQTRTSEANLASSKGVAELLMDATHAHATFLPGGERLNIGSPGRWAVST